MKESMGEILIALALGFLMGTVIAFSLTKSEARKQAAEHGYGGWTINATNGDRVWRWK